MEDAQEKTSGGNVMSLFKKKTLDEQIAELSKKRINVEKEIIGEDRLLVEKEKLKEDQKELSALKNTLHPTLFKQLQEYSEEIKSSLNKKDMEAYKKKKEEQKQLLENAKKKLLEVK